MSARQPILLRPSPLLPGRVYAVTRYTVAPRYAVAPASNVITAREKQDVTDEFVACALALGWTPPREPAP